MKKKIVWQITTIILLSLSVLLLCTSIYYKYYYNGMDAEQLFYTLTEPLTGTSDEVINSIVKYIGIPSAIFIILVLYLYFTTKNGFSHNSKNGKMKVIAFYMSVIMLFSSIFTLLHTVGIGDFIKYQTDKGTFIEENYINPRNVNITFPEEKRNLILIYAESMETSFSSTENGGMLKDDVIPELTQLANDNLNFSNTEKLGGALETVGTTWTTAGITAHSFGLPLKVMGNTYGNNTSFLPKAYSLYDILKDAGYFRFAMKSAGMEFGGLDKMMSDHGGVEKFDIYDATEEGKIPPGYNVFWGFEDAKLFEYAKEKLIYCSEQEKPFFFQLETVDTHFPNGYKCQDCENKWDSNYSNVLSCSSKKISEFVSWIQQQKWYKNTTVIIVGDHLTMEANYLPETKNYNRTNYNTFINTPVETTNNKNRLFSSMDMFPTILASIGCKIDGEQLGLGINLFSEKKTLFEQFGVDFVNKELKKKSIFYNEEIM